MKSRGKPAYHAEAGHRLATTLHLGHLAVISAKSVRWDPDRESFEDDSFKDNPIYQRTSRNWDQA